MRHDIWYTDILNALRLGAEGFITSLNLARDGDGEQSALFININYYLNYAREEIGRLLDAFIKECCACEGSDICTAHETKAQFRLSLDYRKGDNVINIEGQRLNQHLPVETFIGKITSIKIAPDGSTIFIVKGTKGTAQERAWKRELTWQQIEPRAALPCSRRQGRAQEQTAANHQGV